MSRTRKGGKGPGYEFWSSRPGRGGRGRIAKTITHRAERRINKDTARQGRTELVEQDWGGKD